MPTPSVVAGWLIKTFCWLKPASGQSSLAIAYNTLGLFETASLAQAGLELEMQPKLALNAQESACL